MKLHRALGTWGITLGKTYRDIRFDWPSLRQRRSSWVHLFVRQPSSKSWYVLTWHGWQLLRREDSWGTYKGVTANGPAKRRPPLYEFPDGGIAHRAWELRSAWKPYQLVDWYGQQMEVMSFPSPERLSVTIMLRQPGDPTTLQEVVLEQYLPDTGPVNYAAK